MNILKSIVLNTDSYKLGQFLQYPPNTSYIASYGESRGGKFPDTTMFGLQIFLKNVLSKQVTELEVEMGRDFAAAHGTPFNYDGWMRVVTKCDGFLPLEIKAVAEGTTVPTGNALFTIINTDPEFFWLTSYVETALLRAVWYGTTVATNSRAIKKLLAASLMKTGGDMNTLPFKLVDFGARGVSSMESAGIGGAAHLVNFMVTDTITGALTAMEYYNAEPLAKWLTMGDEYFEDKMPGFSIPASEHSTMTSWGGREGEIDAMRNMLKQFAKPGATVAVVSDSYDMMNAAENFWGGELKQEVIDSGATIVIRPDSGDPATVVVDVLNILADKFGTTETDTGYKVLPDCIRVIQGDGITYDSIKEIITAVEDAGFSADNVAYGMGGGMLQQLDRDTQKFAMKASAAFVDDKWIDVFKDPKTDPGKVSKKGRLTLVKDDFGNYRTVRLEHVGDQEVQLKTVFFNGTVTKEYTFDEVRENAAI